MLNHESNKLNNNDDYYYYDFNINYHKNLVTDQSQEEKQYYKKLEDLYENTKYIVDLQGVVQVVDTCYCNNDMQYCPILVKDKYVYQIQVWKQAEIVYQETIETLNIDNERTKIIKSWFINEDKFIYVLQEKDSLSVTLKVVFLQENNSVSQTQLKQKYANQEKLFVAIDKSNYIYLSYQDRLKIFAIDNLNPEQIFKKRSLKLDRKIRDFLSQDGKVIIACETNDNQIEFHQIYFDDSLQKHILCQMKELLYKKSFSEDPIIKHKYVYRNKDHYSVVLKLSGKVDFYYNYTLVGSANDKFQDVSINFNAIYLLSYYSLFNEQKEKIEFNDKLVYKVDLNLKQQLNRHSLDQVIAKIQFNCLFEQMLVQNVKLYDYCLVNTSLIISYLDRLYIYDIINNKFASEFQLEDFIKALSKVTNFKSYFEVAVLLKNRKLKILQLSEEDADKFNPQTWEMKEETTLERVVSMITDNECLYLRTEKGVMHMIMQGQIYNLIENLNENASFIPVQTQLGNRLFLICNSLEDNFQQITIFNHFFDNDNLLQQLQVEEVQSFTISNHVQIQKTLTKNYRQDLILVCQNQIYLVNLKNKEIKQLLSITKIIDVYLLDDIYLYILTQEDGLLIFLLDQLVDFELYSLDQSLAWNYSKIDFCQINQRMAFVNNYSQLTIIPPPNRNTLTFIGFQNRNEYLALNKIQDKFYALNKQNQIIVWNAFTGKYISHSLVEEDYSNYEVYKSQEDDETYYREWYQPRSLIMDKRKIEDINKYQFINRKPEVSNSNPQLDCMKVSFHQFKLIQITSDNDVNNLITFVHPIFSNKQEFEKINNIFGVNKQQRIYISDDLQLMLERINNQEALLYQQPQQIEIQRQPFIWQLKRRIVTFPNSLSDQSYHLFLFSPDLQKYLSYDRKDGLFKIYETDTDQNQDNCLYKMPEYLMNSKTEKVETVIKRFKWVSNEKILVASSWGHEKLFQVSEAGLELQSYSQIFGFHSDDYKQQIYSEPLSYPQSSIFARLRRKNQQYKRCYNIYKKKKDSQLYETLFDIDYNTNHYQPLIELSFTMLCQKLIIGLFQGRLNIQLMSQSTRMILGLNIFIHCETILHQLQICNDQFSFFLKHIPVHDEKSGFQIPFIRNILGQTPLHKAIIDKNHKVVDQLLIFLRNAPIDHHSRDITDVLPKMIELEIPSLLDYLDYRIRQTSQIKDIKYGALKSLNTNSYDTITETEIWNPDQFIKDKMFLQCGDTIPAAQEIKLEILDIPYFHCYYEPNFNIFFNKLSLTKQTEVFKLRSTRILIDYLWHSLKKYIRIYLMFPFFIYLALYVFYNNYFFQYEEEYNIVIPYNVILILFSLYFLLNEFWKLRFSSRIFYFKSFWNYLDTLAPTLVIVISVLDLASPGKVYLLRSVLQAIVSLLLWIKLLQFFRMDKNTGYLIRLIFQVIYRIRYFFAVLVVAIFSFADSFAAILNYDEGETQDIQFGSAVNRFFSQVFYTYQVTLGLIDFSQFDEEQQVPAKVIFTICTLFINIVLLNILIFLIFSIFNTISQDQVNEYYQEKARMILENAHLMPKQRRKQLCKSGEYLLIGTIKNRKKKFIETGYHI